MLTTAACGARWTDEQRAELAARHAGAGSPTASATASGTPSASSGTASSAVGATVPGSASGAPGPASGGAAPSGDASGAPVAALPCTAPSDAPGVSASEITIGSISSLSGPVPGLGASAAAATRAYVAYRNATGGVCGRQIVLREADDGTDNGRYRSVLSELAPQVLGIAGGFALGDVGAVDLITELAIPIVNTPSGQAVADLPTVFDTVPSYEDPHAVIGKYRYLVEQGARRVAMAYLAVDQSRAEAQLQRSLMEAAGLEIVSQQELPLSTLSYDSTARAVANSGADYLFFIADINGEAAMARAMADTGYDLRFAEYYNFAYGTPFIELAGSSAEGTLAWLRSLPNEEASTNPEMAAFVEWMGQIAPGNDLDQFASDTWAATKAFFDVLESIPGPITRDAFVAQLQATETFDAGGMYAPIRLGAERTNACFVGVQVQDGAWHRLAPATGFLC